MASTNPKVDFFFKKPSQWQTEYRKLRAILLSCAVTEELKWGVPAYQSNGKNVALVHGFKEYCAVLFPKGALLKDTKRVLVQQTASTQSARQVRFTGLAEIEKLAPTLKAYVNEAIALEKAGAKVAFKKTSEFAMPEELQARLAGDAKLKAAFEGLTPGRQRAYLLFISSAKQAKTREARVEKHVSRILAGKGLDDE